MSVQTILYNDAIKLEMYKTLRQEQLNLQKRMETLCRWAFVAAAIVWGFMLSNKTQELNYLIAISPALLAPFIYHWVTNLAYSAYRIAVFIKNNCENGICENNIEPGWEQWLDICRDNNEKAKANFSKNNHLIKKLFHLLIEKLKRLQTYNMIFPFIIGISIIISSEKVYVRSIPFLNNFENFKFLIIMGLSSVSVVALIVFRYRHRKLIDEIKGCHQRINSGSSGHTS